MKQVESRLKKLINKHGTICVGLLDSENLQPSSAAELSVIAEKSGVQAILIGGSTATGQIELEALVKQVKVNITIPVILFPGNVTGVSPSADAIFFSCLMNSDNPYFITEAQALAAFAIRRYGLETIPMGYLIIGDGGAAGFIGRARGVPSNKPSLAAMYALAAQYFGMRFFYLEAGSGAQDQINGPIITAVRKAYDGILVVGGGITHREQAIMASKAGADIIVIGSLLEKDKFSTELLDICESISH